MDPRNRSAGQSDFVPVPTDTDFGDPAQWSPDANNGTKIDPYSATQLYGQPWDGYDGAQARLTGINDPRPQDPRVAAFALGSAGVNHPNYDYGNSAVNYYKNQPDYAQIPLIQALLGRR